MELKQRKRINNDRLMKFEGGTNGVTVPTTAQYPTGYAEMDLGSGIHVGATPPNGQDANFGQGSPSDLKADGTNAFGKPVSTVQPSSAGGIGPWFALGEWVGTGVLAGLDAIGGEHNTNQFVRQLKHQFLADAGTSEGSIGGITYEKQNEVSDNDLLNKKDSFWRDAQTSWLTNPFKAMTMMIGKKSYYAKLDAAKEAANREAKYKNSYNSNMALSQMLNNETTSNREQMLYAKCGKDGYAAGKDVETAYGLTNIKPNALVEDGEVIYSPTHSTARVVPGKQKGDNNYSLVAPQDIIFTNKYGLSKLALRPAKALEEINKVDNKHRGSLGKKTDELVKQNAKALLDKIADLQRNMRTIGLLPTDKSNMLHAASGWEAAIPLINSASNMGAAIANYIKLKHEDIKQPNTYRSNPYANIALQGMRNMRINPYNYLKNVYDLYNTGLYSINKAGGLSDSQKGLSRIALNLGTQRNLTDLMTNIDEKNLAYEGKYYDTLYNYGEAERAARTNANRYDLDYYSKAEAAKRSMMNTAWNDIFAQKDQGISDWLKYRQFLDTYNLYNTGKMK